MALSNAIVGTTPTNLYVSVGTSALTFVSLCNFSADTVMVDLYIVPAGSAVTNASLFVKQLELVSNDTYEVYHGAEKLMFSNNDRLVGVASVEDAVAVTVSSIEV